MEELVPKVRRMRAEFDKLNDRDVGLLRRCRDVRDVYITAAYCRSVAVLAEDEKTDLDEGDRLAHLVQMFPLVRHKEQDGFSFGRLLRQLADFKPVLQIGIEPRLRLCIESGLNMESRSRQLHGLLRLVDREKRSVDWAVLGADILTMDDDDGRDERNPRRRWAMGFWGGGE